MSTGHESVAEFIDIDLDESSPRMPSEADLAGLPLLITAALPIGLEVTGLAIIPSNSTSLQQAVESCEWDIEIRGAGLDDVAAAIARVLAA